MQDWIVITHRKPLFFVTSLWKLSKRYHFCRTSAHNVLDTGYSFTFWLWCVCTSKSHGMYRCEEHKVRYGWEEHKVRYGCEEHKVRYRCEEHELHVWVQSKPEGNMWIWRVVRLPALLLALKFDPAVLACHWWECLFQSSLCLCPKGSKVVSHCSHLPSSLPNGDERG